MVCSEHLNKRCLRLPKPMGIGCSTRCTHEYDETAYIHNRPSDNKVAAQVAALLEVYSRGLADACCVPQCLW